MLALVLARWAQLTSTLLLFGYTCFLGYALDAPARANVRRTTARTLPVLGVFALLSAGAWWLCEAAAMTGQPDLAFDPRTLAAVLMQTAFGHLWFVRLLLAALSVGIVARGRFGSSERWALMATSGVLLVSLAGTGHAVAQSGANGVVRQIEDGLHLGAAGLWSGGLLGLTIVLALGRTEDAPAADVVRAAERFSAVSVYAVAVIAATGALNALALVGSWQALASSNYGRLLCLKIAAFAAALCLAALNRFRMLRKLQAVGPTWSTNTQLRRGVMLEHGFVQVAILVVSVFGILPPPADS